MSLRRAEQQARRVGAAEEGVAAELERRRDAGEERAVVHEAVLLRPDGVLAPAEAEQTYGEKPTGALPATHRPPIHRFRRAKGAKGVIFTNYFGRVKKWYAASRKLTFWSHFDIIDDVLYLEIGHRNEGTVSVALEG